MRDLEENESNTLTGQLLVSLPQLHDPNFYRTVVLMSVHSESEGAMGVVLNRPTGQTIGEAYAQFKYSKIGSVPVYEGGPVGKDQFVLAAWRWPSNLHTFELFFGATEEKMEELMDLYEDLEVRCFQGHSGWSPMQLEREIQQQAWLISPMRFDILQFHDGVDLWKKLTLEINPDLAIEVNSPEDPSNN
jgi:putative transcriptional regulator